MVWPALIAAAGSIGGGLLANRNAPNAGDATFLPGIQTDPLYQQLQLMSMLGLGQQITPQMLQSASPLATLLANAQSIGLKQKGALAFSKLLPDLQRVISQGAAAGKTAAQIKADLQALPFWGANKSGGGPLEGLAPAGGDLDPLGLFDKSSKPDKEKGREVMRRLMAAAGYNSLDDLIQAELDFETNNAGRVDRYNQVSSATEQGRLDALSKIAGIQSGFIAPTAENLAAQTSDIETALRGQIAREAADQQAALLQAAQVGRYNPGGGMGRLGEWQAQANLEAGPDAVARALQLLGGQQSLQTNALSALQASLSGAEATPLNLLQLRSGNQLGIGQLTAQQALALTGMQQQGNQLLGQGLSNAAGSVANALTLADLLKQFPQTGSTTTGDYRVVGQSPTLEDLLGAR